MTLETSESPSSPTLGRLERRKAFTRAAILRAAGDLFQKNGYEATSIQQIADAADTGVGTVYGYFSSKDEILREVLRAHAEVALHRYQEAIREDTPSIERVLLGFTTFSEFVREYRSILLAAVQSSARKPQVDDQISTWLFAAYSGLLKEGIERGDLRPVPIAATVRTLISAYSMGVLGIGAWADVEDSEVDRELESFVRALLEK